MEKVKLRIQCVEKKFLFLIIIILTVCGIIFLCNESMFGSFLQIPVFGIPIPVVWITNNTINQTHGERVASKTGVSPEKHHVGYLKVHKTGSSTIQNIFNRFVLSRDLTEVLPSKSNYISDFHGGRKWFILPPPGNKTFDMLFHHCKFNDQVFRTLLPNDTIYIASVREPTSRFISAFCYYRNFFKENYYLLKVKGRDSELIHEFLRDARGYDKRLLSDTRNRMAGDFGYPQHYFTDMNLFDEFLEHLGKFFNFVIIAEYFNESIVYVRRLLGWSIKDVLFIKINSLPKEDNCKTNLSREEVIVFKDYSPLDFKIYDFFLDKFVKILSQQSSDFFDEVKYYSNLLNDVSSYCNSENEIPLNVPSSKWSNGFELTVLDCKYISMGETDFINLLKSRRYQQLSMYGENKYSPLPRLKILNMTLFSKFKF